MGDPVTFTLETVKAHLRIDHEAEDGLILAYMAAARDFAETFLGRKLDDFESVPPIVAAGMLVHVALMYEQREMEIKGIQMDTIRVMYWPYRVVSV